jgi:hypothetical protein
MPDLAQQLADLSRRVAEIEQFIRHTNEVVEQGLLGDLVLEATVLAPMPPMPSHVRPEELAEIIRTVLREELGQARPH